jgi:drug/metabolite transporter (DMT)-like permease
MTLQALPYVGLLGFLFGSSLIATRFSVGQFHPVSFIALRLAMASLAHVTIYTLSRHRRWPTDRRLWRHAAVLGVVGTALPMSGVATSLQYQSGGITAVLITVNPALTVLFAHFFLPDEHLNWLKGAGVVMALGGAALLALRGESGLPDISQANPIGYLLVLGAMVIGSSMTIYARKFMKDLDAVDVASVRMFSAALFLIPVSALMAGFDLHAVDVQGYMGLLYAGLVGTFAGFMLAFHNIQRFGATAAAMTAYIMPLVTGIGGVLILSETFTLTMLVAFAIIILGIFTINRGSLAGS